MATKAQPCPRKWNRARYQSVQAGMEIINLAAPLTKDQRYRGDPTLMNIVAQVIYYAHHIIDELTSVPSEDERKSQ